MCAVCRGARSSWCPGGRRANRINWLLHNWWMAWGRRKHRNLLSRLHWDRLHGHGHRHWHVAWHNMLPSWVVIRVDRSRSWRGSDYNASSSSSTTSMMSRWWLWFIDRTWVVAVRAGPILWAERILHAFTLTVRTDSLTNNANFAYSK